MTPRTATKKATKRVVKRTAEPRTIQRPPSLGQFADAHARVQQIRRELVAAETVEMDMLDRMVGSGKYRVAEVAAHVGQGRQGLTRRLERYRARKGQTMPESWKGWLGE